MSGMDHLVPPLAFDQPMYEAMSTNMWLAAHTSTLKVGSLVLCDAFRHPAMLAREAVAIDNASGGRFEFGIGSGSVEDEFATFGVGPASARDRTTRLGETLEVLRRIWSGETFSFDGEYFTITEGRQLPTPLEHIPIVVGGAGPAHHGTRGRVRRLVELPAPPARQARRDARPGGLRAHLHPTDGHVRRRRVGA